MTLTKGSVDIRFSKATIRFSPRSSKPLLFDIPVIATGNYVTSIVNVNLLKSYLRSLVSYKSYSFSIFNQLWSLQNNLPGIWQSKADVYFEKSQDANDFVQQGLDSTSYVRVVLKLKRIKYSYVELKSFLNVMISDFLGNSSTTGLLSALSSFHNGVSNELLHLKWSPQKNQWDLLVQMDSIWDIQDPCVFISVMFPRLGEY